MILAYTAKLGLKVCPTNIKIQKIDGSLLKTFGMVILGFQMIDKLDRAWFFKETFLLANTSIEVILEILSLTFSNTDVQFIDKELTWRSYIIEKALSTTRQVELINKKEFAKTVLDGNAEAFIMHIVSFTLKKTIHLAQKGQIALLLPEKVTIPAEYINFMLIRKD